MPPNGWAEWSKHVLAELKRLNGCYEKLDKKLNVLVTEVAMLKIKAGVWGILGGAMTVALLLVVNSVKNME